MGAEKKSWRVLVRKPERKRPLGRHRRRCEDSIKMDFTELVWGSLDWIYVAWNRDSSRLL